MSSSNGMCKYIPPIITRYVFASYTFQVNHLFTNHSYNLIWELIKYLSDKTVSYDFEGSMDEGIEYFYRSFGGEQTPFFQVVKYRNRLYELLLKGRL